jgi:dolichol-phosphate mannosyltransferase
MTTTSISPAALVVVPTYNEHENLPLLVDGLMRHANVRLLVVDDQSPDGTGDLAEALARQHQGRISVLHRTTNRGLGRSYVDGLKLALREPVDVICQMDADLSHDPAQLPRLLEGASRGEVVIGSRYIPGGEIVNWPKRRQLLSRFANAYIRTITRLAAHDCTSGYRCWRRDALATLPLDRLVSDGYSYLVDAVVASQHDLRSSRCPSRLLDGVWANRAVARGDRGVGGRAMAVDRTRGRQDHQPR